MLGFPERRRARRVAQFTELPAAEGVAVSLAGLAAIPALRTMEPSRPTGGGVAPGRPPAAKEVHG
jgi:hypothetical protein